MPYRFHDKSKEFRPSGFRRLSTVIQTQLKLLISKDYRLSLRLITVGSKFQNLGASYAKFPLCVCAEETCGAPEIGYNIARLMPIKEDILFATRRIKRNNSEAERYSYLLDRTHATNSVTGRAMLAP